MRILVLGAFGFAEAIGYTLYYTTNLIFTGLAVAVAFHAGLFNIGGEGQAYIGGLGVGLVMPGLDHHLPFIRSCRLRMWCSPRRPSAPPGPSYPAYLQAQARQPHRHHDHHVQLPRLGADGLPDGQRAHQAGADVAGEPRSSPTAALAALRARAAAAGRHSGSTPPRRSTCRSYGPSPAAPWSGC